MKKVSAHARWIVTMLLSAAFITGLFTMAFVSVDAPLVCAWWNNIWKSAPGQRIRIVKLTCKKTDDAWGYNDTELRITDGSWMSRRHAWRSRMGTTRKAHTWYINEVIEVHRPMIVGLWDIEIGFGLMNQEIGIGSLDPSTLQGRVQPIPLTGAHASYELHWEHVEEHRRTVTHLRQVIPSMTRK